MEFVNYKIDDIIISIKTGKTPSTKEKLYFDGDIPWITTSDLKGQKVLDYTEKTISKLALIENEAFTFEKNTVIVSTIGEIGKACIIKRPMACNQQLSGVVVNDNIIHSELFYYWLVKNQELLKFKANKAIISILNNKLLRSIPISFPKNLENQRKIIAQLDQIQNVIDLKIKTIEVYDKLILSIYFQMFGDPITNDKKWKTKKLSEIGVWKSGGTPKTNVDDYYNGNIPWFTSGELGELFINKSKKHISTLAVEKSNAKIIQKHSIMIGMYDTAAFKMSINDLDCSCNQAILYSKPKDEFYLYTIYYTLLISKRYFLDKRKGARQKNLSSTFIKNIDVIYPNNKEGKVLVEKFNSYVISIFTSKQVENESLIVLEKLFKSVLNNSFKEDVKINEEHIFDDLIKKYSVEDLKSKRERLQYLVNLFSKGNLNDVLSYNNAKEKLFELLDEEVIEQTFDGEYTKINVR